MKFPANDIGCHAHLFAFIHYRGLLGPFGVSGPMQSFFHSPVQHTRDSRPHMHTFRQYNFSQMVLKLNTEFFVT